MLYMQTHLLRVTEAEARLDELRTELMAFSDVLEVSPPPAPTRL